MGDMREYFDDWKRFWKDRRKKHLDTAEEQEFQQRDEPDAIEWTKHTEWHWSTMLNGERLDYWPSGTKFRYKNKTYRGTIKDVTGFIRNRTKKG